MYNKILVPLDGSSLGECVLEHVITVAKGCNVPEVQLLFVTEPVSSGLYQSAAEGREKLTTWGKDYLDKIEKRLSTDGINAQSVIIEGKPAESIADYATNNNMDLIIMSTHGRSGPSRWAFGSVADRVVRSSRVPVLIVVPKECRIS